VKMLLGGIRKILFRRKAESFSLYTVCLEESNGFWYIYDVLGGLNSLDLMISSFFASFRILSCGTVYLYFSTGLSRTRYLLNFNFLSIRKNEINNEKSERSQKESKGLGF